MASITITFDPTDEYEVKAVKGFFFSSLPSKTTEPAKTTVSTAAPSTADAAPSTSAPEDDADTSPAPQSGDLDVEGTPWDERIHSGNRTKTQAGVWTRRRNVPDEVYNRVLAELRGAPSAPVAPLPPSAPAAAPLPPAPPVAAPQPDERAAVVPPVPHVNPFVALVKRVASEQKEGKYTADTVNSLIESMGSEKVHSLSDFAANHDLIPQLVAMLDAL